MEAMGYQKPSESDKVVYVGLISVLMIQGIVVCYVLAALSEPNKMAKSKVQ